MTNKNYLNLLEYKRFLAHFNTKPFTIYNFTCIPLDCHVQALLTLQPSYYNSFYIVSLLKAYFSETKEIGDIETIQELATRIFRFEDKEDLLVSHDTVSSVKITGKDAKNEICNIKKLLTMLNDYQSDECRQKIEFITNSILVMECVDFQYKLLFLEAFVTSVDTVVLYKNIVYRTLSFLSTLDFTVYLNEKNSEDDLNFNIDYLELCLYIANIYLEKKDTIEMQNHNAAVPKTVLEEQVDVLYEVKIKEMEEINIEHQHFAFSTTFFDEAYALLTTSQVLEDDLFVIFKLTFSILILSTAHNDDNVVGQVIGKTMSSKEFMIREELMVDLQLQIIKCLYVIKNQQLSMQHLNLLLNSNAIVFLTKNNRARVISCLNRYEILSMDERIKIIRKAYFNIKLSLEDDKGKKVLSEERAGMLCVFLEYIGYSDSSFNFIEINNYFTSLSNYEESIEYYADFLSRNNFEAPLWTFLRSSETLYIIKFYMSFFKKVKRNYEQRRLKYENEKVDYSVIIDKHVTNFCKIFIERKDIDLANVLNAIPYLPEKPEYFAIYFHVWRFIFDNNAENEMQFFGYKTPALIKLSLGNDACTEINNHLLEKVDKLLGKERQDTLFSYDNIRKYYTDFQFVLILFIEREKIRNYMFDGIYGYINDTKLLKNGLEPLIFVMKGIHYSFKIKYDILKEYLLKLLEIFLYSYESTKRVVFEILKLLLKNEKYLAFDLDINVKYNECIKSLKNGRKSKKSQALLNELAQTYRTKFLDVIRNEAKILHDYLILFFCDIDLFAETKINGHGNFAEINAYVKLEMEKILSFSKNEYDKEITDVNERYQWLVDTAYMNRYDHTLIRQIICFLKFLLKENYCLDKLYVLIKIYNIIGIRDEDFEQFLKMAIHIPLNFNCKIGTIQRLYEETSDFYRYYFSQLLFLYSEYSTKIMAIPFPTKKGIYDIFTEEDIIFIQNMFQKKIIYDFLSVRNEKHHLRFFYNQNELSILDIVSIVRNSNDKELIRIALQRLKSCNIIKFVPQLVQCLQRKETFADVFLVLHKLCTDEHVCHFLLWNLKSNVTTKGDIYSNCVKDIESTYGHRKVSEDKLGNENSTHEFLQEMQFFDELTDVSSQMMPYLKSPKEDKRLKINEFLSRINVPAGIFLPTNTEYDIVKIVPNSGRVLQSHAKVPFMASFYCVKRDLLTDDLRECIKNDLIDASDQKESVIIQNLIFKAGDDCRQDILAIQLISMFKDIFEKNNLDLYLFPYQVIATGPETGIIEVIPNAITRDQMGREKINNLVDYFEYKFGFRESESYIKAVHNFTKSFAAYSLVTYFLNIKDRHNGNIMIDKDGHIIHIDFGYMFEISPGNMNLEIPIKLTREIHDLLLSSEMYDVYIDLMLKGFFVLRRNSKDIIFMVDSFKDSGLQCYKKKAVDNFIDKFKFKLTDDEAKIFVVSMVNNSVKRMRTWMYDKYQELTNNIAF